MFIDMFQQFQPHEALKEQKTWELISMGTKSE